MAAPYRPRYALPSVLPIQAKHLTHRIGMLGRRIARRRNAVGDTDPALGSGRQHRHAPAEAGIAATGARL